MQDPDPNSDSSPADRPQGGGYSHCFFIRRLKPTIYHSPPPPKKKQQKHQEFQAPKKKYLKFNKPPKYPLFRTLTLRKDPKMHRNDPYVQFCDDPKKVSSKSSTPLPPTQKKNHFLKTPKNIEIQNFEPPKNDPSLRLYEHVRVPPPPPLGDRQRVNLSSF